VPGVSRIHEQEVKGVKDFSISAQSLSAGCVAGWRAVFGKSGGCEEKCEPIIIRDAETILSNVQVYQPLAGLPADFRADLSASSEADLTASGVTY